MKTAEQYLMELESKLCEKIVSVPLEEDNRFETKREMQKYNCGISDAMKLVREILDSDDFKSPLGKMIR